MLSLLGGVYSRIGHEGIGHSLLEARSQGVERAILFTKRENLAAQAAYRGIGFRATGEEFGLVLFANS
ncbi:MAG: GNAT family N-acetyltransferase [Aulosira sp. ZfuVER01]|nr:hypothetical protein [Aulosira sp. ZfuVER01]MDZ8000566.1 hypothetical protein [Aulosira sp. DedVER01a]MDZ8056490.1 hypothetical protein [Aulosira sp. ZfuCHP01]